MMAGAGQGERRLRLPLAGGGRMHRGLARLVEPPLSRLLAVRALEQVYSRVPPGLTGAEFAEALLDVLQVRVRISDLDLPRIPAGGPLVVVANHPFGGIEGIILAALLHKVRPDVKLLANYLLQGIPELSELFIFVDPFGRQGSVAGNAAGIRRAVRWVKGGGLLGVFPAGEVAHLHLSRFLVTDPEWANTAATIARLAGAAILPFYFHGANGPLFHVAGLVHPRLRTALLPRELFNKRGCHLDVRVGDAVSARRQAAVGDAAAVTRYVRERTFLLARRQQRGGRWRLLPLPRRPQPLPEPVAPAQARQDLVRDVEALPRSQWLVESGEFLVAYGTAAELPAILPEIGRLREETFRIAGEGTGKTVDLDRFDRDYLHLFVWNRDKQELVGAYRLGQSDRLTAAAGKAGMYTSTLFEFRGDFFERLGPALEMGRSFIRPEYQRSYAGLLLLWRGIGQFVVAHPRYRTLFGPVSISNGYQLISRQLIVAYLKRHHPAHQLSRLVKARNPFRRAGLPKRRGPAPSSIGDLEEVSTLVSHIEADQKGVPVLLKQYLKLGGGLLGFNVDPEFSDVLDVLLAVDLTATDPRVLEKYMGREGAAAFLSHHLPPGEREERAG